MIALQEPLEDKCDVVARARHRGKLEMPYKRILKTFKLEGDFIVLELAGDANSERWLVSASTEETPDKVAGYGVEYFDTYPAALECFRGLSEKYGVGDYDGEDFGSD